MTGLRTRGLRAGYRLARAGLFRYAGGDAEKVHELTLKALARVPGGARPQVSDPVTGGERVETGRWLASRLGRETGSRVGKALAAA